MLEIVPIWIYGKRLGETAEDKGNKSWPFRLTFAAMWIGGEIIGAIVGKYWN